MVTVGVKVSLLPISLGTTYFLLHHIHAFTIHVMVLTLVSFIPFVWEFSRVDILHYKVHPRMGDLVHLTYPGSDN